MIARDFRSWTRQDQRQSFVVLPKVVDSTEDCKTYAKKANQRHDTWQCCIVGVVGADSTELAKANSVCARSWAKQWVWDATFCLKQEYQIGNDGNALTCKHVFDNSLSRDVRWMPRHEMTAAWSRSEEKADGICYLLRLVHSSPLPLSETQTLSQVHDYDEDQLTCCPILGNKFWKMHTLLSLECKLPCPLHDLHFDQMFPSLQSIQKQDIFQTHACCT